MTVPTADPGVAADISTRIAAIQSLVANLSALSAPSATSAADFASAMVATGSARTGSTTATPNLAATSTGGSASTQQVVDTAESYLGTPYVWGGESRSGIDCSGLVQATYGSLGIHLPRTAAEQSHEGTAVPSLADAHPGDLLTFGDPAYHVAIYLGNNQLIESPEPGKTVHITDVYQTPTSIRRILPTEATTTALAPPAPSGTGLSAATLGSAGINSAVAAYEPQFAAAEAKYNLPSGVLAAVAQQESGGNANVVSKAGAQGLMQLMPSTAAGYGVDAFDPAQAIPAAARILSANLSQFGSLPLALAAYNAGAGAVRQYGGIPPYSETQNYVRNITAMLGAGG